MDESWLADFVAPFRVRPGSQVVVETDFDPRFKPASTRRSRGREMLARGIELLAEYQSRLYAQDTHAVLVVLQALDAAGKDGTIRHVMSGVNPQGVSVSSFKVPSAEELDHDYLWRYAQRLPAARRDRHLQPLALRGGARRPRPPGAARAPAAPARARRARGSGSAATGRSTTGSGS